MQRWVELVSGIVAQRRQPACRTAAMAAGFVTQCRRTAVGAVQFEALKRWVSIPADIVVLQLIAVQAIGQAMSMSIAALQQLAGAMRLRTKPASAGRQAC